LGDVDHPVDKFRDLLYECGEFVDDDEQARWGVGVTGFFQRGEVLRFLAVEEVFAVTQLCPERGQCPAHKVRGEVGHQSNGVGKVDAVGERCAAFVVDEQEGESIGAVGGSHSECPCL